MTSLELRKKHLEQLKNISTFTERAGCSFPINYDTDNHYIKEYYIKERTEYILDDFKRCLSKNNQKQKDYYKIISVIQLKPKNKLYDILYITKRKVNLKKIQKAILEYFNTHKTYSSTLISLECIKIK
ncbi:hypothetical protein EOL94_04670 [bacterium]|nr:hypothetical protein [bacterium]